MKLKVESEKVGLKLNIQKTKIMASGPITSWEIHGETVETVPDFIFLGSKITVDGDCSHEIKRRLLLGRKVMTNLDSIFKSRDITLPIKVHRRRQWHPTPVLLPGKSLDGGALWAAVHGVAEGRIWLSDFTFPFHFHALEKEMATHSSVLAWRIPGMAEPGGLLSMGLHRVGYDWSDLAAAAVTKHGEGNGTPLQYSCLENPMDGGAWWAAVQGSLRVRHDWATLLSLFTFMNWRRKWQPIPVFLPR